MREVTLGLEIESEIEHSSDLGSFFASAMSTLLQHDHVRALHTLVITILIITTIPVPASSLKGI